MKPAALPKSHVLQAAQKFVEKRLNELAEALSELRSSQQSEGKSAAGDKHETSASMKHQEQERLSAQFDLMKRHHFSLQNFSGSYHQVAPGALVETDQYLLFVGVALGKISVGEQDIMCVSESSPMVKLLLGHTSGEKVFFNGKEVEILRVC